MDLYVFYNLSFISSVYQPKATCYLILHLVLLSPVEPQDKCILGKVGILKVQIYSIISMITGYSYPRMNDAEPPLLQQHFKDGLKPTSQYPITNTFVFLLRYTKM